MQQIRFDFLVPDDAYADINIDNKGVGQFLVDALDEWVKDETPEVRVRLFHTHFTKMLGDQKSGILGHNPSVIGVVAFTVGSNGLVRVDDTLRSTSDIIFEPIGHISNLKLEDILTSPAMQEYAMIGSCSPEPCSGCVWENVCSGGRIVNRYSVQNRFDNKTVYCSATRHFLSRIASHLLSMGVAEEKINAAIQI